MPALPPKADIGWACRDVRTPDPETRFRTGLTRGSSRGYHVAHHQAAFFQLARTERIRTSKYFLGVAQKAHIKSTSQVILSDTETTNRGFLCLAPIGRLTCMTTPMNRGFPCHAPIGRLTCMTTRFSRSLCSALKPIRQSNNANERCIRKRPGRLPPGSFGNAEMRRAFV